MTIYPTYKLGEICEILNGYAFQSKKYVDKGFRVIRITNVQCGKIIDDEPKFYPIELLPELSKYQLFENDILISLTGNVGRVGLLPKSMTPAALNQRVACVRINDSKLLFKTYLFYVLNNSIFEKQCVASSKGVAQKNMSTEWLKDYTIQVPPLPTQRAIVARIEELFSKLDSGVASLRKAQLQLKIYRQAVLNEQLTKGKWKTVKLGEVIERIEAGKSFRCNEKAPNNEEKGIVKVSAVTWGEYNEEESKTITDDKQFNPKYLIELGDFLFSRANTMQLVGACVIVKNKPRKALALSDKILRLKFVDTIVPSYILYFLRSTKGRYQIEQFSTGNQESMRNIGQDRIRQILFPLPPLSEQQQIVREIESRLSVCDKAEQQIAEALQKAEALRQSILQKAFSGELLLK